MQIITRYLGIDYGEKRIGLAMGDSESKIAIPFTVVANLAEVVKVIKEEEIDEIVIGLPLTMRSEAGLMKDEVDRFVGRLKAEVNLPIVEIDERLSSKSADKLLGGRDKSRRDAVAAMVILQTYLDGI
jgi:putative Holliday junction resolvase